MNKQDYIFFSIIQKDNRTVAELSNEYDLLIDEINPPVPQVIPPEHEFGIGSLVDAWLKSLPKETDTEKDYFNTLRKSPYVDQYNAWDAAGRIGE